MKIAVVTNNGDTVSQHFGRSRYFKVYTVEDQKIVGSELRERKFGHFAAGHAHSHHQEHGHDHGQGHGYGHGDPHRHLQMAGEISDCQVLIAGGMGMGAYDHMRAAGLETILTDYHSIEEAVTAYVEGKITNLFESRTH